MSVVLERTLHGQWLNSVLVGAFAAMALLSATAGLYGVVWYLTAHDSASSASCVAVGAKVTDVLTLVLKQGLGHAALGLALGLRFPLH